MMMRLAIIATTVMTSLLPAITPATVARAATIEIFHADSLAGPMRELTKAFEAKNPGVTLKLTSGTSKQLAERVLKGDVCDVLASSSPAVIDQDMMGKKVEGTAQDAASWYVVFSANEMVVITAKNNPLGVKFISDLAKPGVTFVRITGEKDLGTGRTVEFLKRAAAKEGHLDLAQKIVDAAIVPDPSKPTAVPDVVNAVKTGKANAGVVYYSAAVAARDDIGVVRFPADVNLSEAIRNAATVTGTANDIKNATAFVRFLLTPEAQTILTDTGQPPIVPAIRKGVIPVDVDG